jgi:Zinc-binding dehydrogenase
VINYVETPDWHEEIVKLTSGRGADCVVEIGGPSTLTNSIKALAVGGHISLIGSSLSRSGIMLDPLLLGGRGMSLGSISVGSRADFEAMNRAIALHRLRPVIDRGIFRSKRRRPHTATSRAAPISARSSSPTADAARPLGAQFVHRCHHRGRTGVATMTTPQPISFVGATADFRAGKATPRDLLELSRRR